MKASYAVLQVVAERLFIERNLFELLAKVSVNLSSILSKSNLNRVYNNLLLLVTYEIKHDLNIADEQPKWVFYRDSRYLSN